MFIFSCVLFSGSTKSQLIYLKDVDEQEVELQDDRPEYQNQSEGYLKFRNLNQGIIIRNTNSEFIEGLNPNSIEYLQMKKDLLVLK